MINASSCFPPNLMRDTTPIFAMHAARIISQVRTIAAFAYRKSRGMPIIYPKPTYQVYRQFPAHDVFRLTRYDLPPEVVRALDLIFLLHADHEQNCSTSTVRMVASAKPTCSRRRPQVCVRSGVHFTAAPIRLCSKCSTRYSARATTVQVHRGRQAEG